jgi:hypothetical protein
MSSLTDVIGRQNPLSKVPIKKVKLQKRLDGPFEYTHTLEVSILLIFLKEKMITIDIDLPKTWDLSSKLKKMPARLDRKLTVDTSRPVYVNMPLGRDLTFVVSREIPTDKDVSLNTIRAALTDFYQVSLTGEEYEALMREDTDLYTGKISIGQARHEAMMGKIDLEGLQFSVDKNTFELFIVG